MYVINSATLLINKNNFYLTESVIIPKLFQTGFNLGLIIIIKWIYMLIICQSIGLCNDRTK